MRGWTVSFDHLKREVVVCPSLGNMGRKGGTVGERLRDQQFSPQPGGGHCHWFSSPQTSQGSPCICPWPGLPRSSTPSKEQSRSTKTHPGPPMAHHSAFVKVDFQLPQQLCHGHSGSWRLGCSSGILACAGVNFPALAVPFPQVLTAHLTAQSTSKLPPSEKVSIQRWLTKVPLCGGDSTFPLNAGPLSLANEGRMRSLVDLPCSRPTKTLQLLDLRSPRHRETLVR
ncbi:hypothetical protein F5144DRAFT_51945 [Chaetomium tenue]|uniref:Uncharacterized protein n=1 Tax=Chaetomium tenue TaxID=1854479 RepID=A0ACB7PT03_9PEZI|nr:hypothetical protein F5144DRAFT_51945 [Chaetomium globosum]